MTSWYGGSLPLPTEGKQLITALIEFKDDDTRPFFEFGGKDLMDLLGVLPQVQPSSSP